MSEILDTNLPSCLWSDLRGKQKRAVERGAVPTWLTVVPSGRRFASDTVSF